MTRRLSSRQTRAAIDRIGIERSLLPAFAVADEARRVRYAMHAHSRHQLILSSAGSFWVETRDHLHVCDASTGLWIPARLRHATTMGAHAGVSTFFAPSRYASPVRGATPVAVTPLVRQMALAGVEETQSLPATARRHFFDVLFALVARSLRTDAEPMLARPRDSGLADAVDHLLLNLDTATVPRLARIAGLSERSLRRRFLIELRLTPERYIRRARLLRAAQLLVTDTRLNVLEIGVQVGYSSQSAFASAFRQMFGTTPRAMRQSGRFTR